MIIPMRRRRRGVVPTLFEEGYYAEKKGKPRRPPKHYNLQAAAQWDKGWRYAADIRTASKLMPEAVDFAHTTNVWKSLQPSQE
jgi:hypothetical protein